MVTETDAAHPERWQPADDPAPVDAGPPQEPVEERLADKLSTDRADASAARMPWRCCAAPAGTTVPPTVLWRGCHPTAGRSQGNASNNAPRQPALVAPQ